MNFVLDGAMSLAPRATLPFCGAHCSEFGKAFSTLSG
jgi:hypothetical protein